MLCLSAAFFMRFCCFLLHFAAFPAACRLSVLLFFAVFIAFSCFFHTFGYLFCCFRCCFWLCSLFLSTLRKWVTLWTMTCHIFGKLLDDERENVIYCQFFWILSVCKVGSDPWCINYVLLPRENAITAGFQKWVTFWRQQKVKNELLLEHRVFHPTLQKGRLSTVEGAN